LLKEPKALKGPLPKFLGSLPRLQSFLTNLLLNPPDLHFLADSKLKSITLCTLPLLLSGLKHQALWKRLKKRCLKNKIKLFSPKNKTFKYFFRF
jgi:hypothetical protein